MVEKPAPEDSPSDLSIVGRYILQPEIFDILSETPHGRNNEIQLTDAMQKMISTDKFYALQFEGERFDCGSQEGFLEANIAYSLDNKSIAKEVRKFLGKYVGA